MIHMPSLRPLCAQICSRFRAACRRLARRPAPARFRSPSIEVVMEPGVMLEECPKGCGWFDSSYELGQGLLVCEHGPDTAAQALAAAPLADWLALQLSGWRPPVPAQA